MKTLIVIPAFNEATNLARLLPELLATASYDVVIINDASTDETAQVAKAHDVACFTLPIQLGAWGADAPTGHQPV